MKNFIIIVLIFFVFQQWDDISRFVNPPPNYGAAHAGNVILYATNWCDYCKKARKLLSDNNIPYYEYDIEKSQEGMKQYKRLGGKGVPVLLINGEVLKGYSPTEILRLAGKNQ